MVFCNRINKKEVKFVVEVTILILIDGFLQWERGEKNIRPFKCHNPYFNRWFSAMEPEVEVKYFQWMSQSLF